MIELGVVEVTDSCRIELLSDSIRSAGLVNISTERGVIIVTPAVDMTCPFCGRLGVVELRGRYVCSSCIKQLKQKRRKKNETW